MSDSQVLIVGSGPSGLALALAMIRNGVKARVIEKDAEHHIGERGPGVMPRTLEIEHFLGIKDKVVAAGVSWPRRHFYDPSNPKQASRTIEMLEKVDPTPAFPITKGVMLGQYRHQAIFRSEIEKLGGSIELGTSLINFTQDDEGVAAEITKCVDGVERKEVSRFKYIIGADGGRSTVRKILGVDFVGTTEDSARVYIVDAAIQGFDEAPKVTGDFFEFKSGTEVVALRGTGIPNKFQILFVVSEAKLLELAGNRSVEAIQAEITRITGRVDIIITNITWQGSWRPNLRIASNFKKGNVFLIGDAAHTHSPTGGQGLNSSIQDSFNLGWKLSLAQKGYASGILLDSYEVERIPVISEMLQITTDIYKKQIQDVKHLEQMDILKASPEADPHFRSRKLFQLTVNYRWSPIVYDERFKDTRNRVAINAYGSDDQEVRAGDRAPDAPELIQLTSSTTEHSVSCLFDLFLPQKHTILLFSPSLSEEKIPALLVPLQKLEKNLFQVAIILNSESIIDDSISLHHTVFKDAGGHAFSGYGIKDIREEPLAVVVRPDAMIGAFIRSASGLEEYLSNVFHFTELK